MSIKGNIEFKTIGIFINKYAIKLFFLGKGVAFTSRIINEIATKTAVNRTRFYMVNLIRSFCKINLATAFQFYIT